MMNNLYRKLENKYKLFKFIEMQPMNEEKAYDIKLAVHVPQKQLDEYSN